MRWAADVATDRRSSRADHVVRPWTALAAIIALLAAANALNNRYAPTTYPVNSVLATGVVLLAFRAGGGTAADLGLDRASLSRGARWALVLAAAVAVVYAAAAAHPATDTFFHDRRVAGLGGGELAYAALIRVPLGTVLLEEVAFRGVIWGLGRRMWGTWPATAVSAVLFGLWHILPARHIQSWNPAVNEMVASPLLATIAALGLVTLAGVALCEVRRRTGSLLPAAGLHWATNGLGFVVAYLLTRG